ncbi:hypothetical protein [Mesorhizobium hawassense]|uniref:hypothetical protein n=1 Tax=Mesorhizobium hawassense TaxID=1209954 RepID=UPI001FE0EA39|nr:hypothetical protein [Mesorhizobium hawassense]
MTREFRQEDSAIVEARGAEHHGRFRAILFPSLRHAGGTNLVIFPANLVERDQVILHDPDHRLPKNQSSRP